MLRDIPLLQSKKEKSGNGTGNGNHSKKGVDRICNPTSVYRRLLMQFIFDRDALLVTL